MIKFYCIHCGTEISVKPESAGVAFRCPSCMGEIVVPGQVPLLQMRDQLNKAPSPASPVPPPIPPPVPPVPGGAAKSKKLSYPRIIGIAIAALPILWALVENSSRTPSVGDIRHRVSENSPRIRSEYNSNDRGKLEVETSFNIRLTPEAYIGYQLCYETGRSIGRHLDRSELEGLARGRSPSCDPAFTVFLVVALEDGNLGRPNRLGGIDIDTLKSAGDY